MTTTLFNQVLASTELDGHGEQRDKGFLDDLKAAMPPRIVLNQHHEHGLPTVGFIENLRVEPEGAGWVLKGDVTFDGEPPSSGGFSFSKTEHVYRAAEARFSVFVPFPYYSDDTLLQGLAQTNPDASVGRWIKKSLALGEIALIISTTGIIIGPAWKRVYDEHVHPRLANIAKSLRERMIGSGAKRARADFLQPLQCEYYDNPIEVFFVASDDVSEDVVFGFAVREALDQGMTIIQDDWLRAAKPIKRIVFTFNDSAAEYKPVTVIYTDGSARGFT